MEHCYADINGVRLHYVKSGAGPLMILLHGFPEFWYAWRELIPEFAKDHLVVAPDLRGYNLSSKPADVAQYGIQFLIEDVRALAQDLGYQQFTLVGHDWGGSISWAFAIKNPQYLEKLIILNAPHPGVFGKLLRDNPEQQKASEYMTAFQTPGIENWMASDHFAALKRAMGFTFAEEERIAYEEAWSQPGALAAAVNYYRARRPTPPGMDLSVHVPTLVLWGERDHALTIYNLDGLDAFVPALKIKRFPDASHWIVHEKPNEVKLAIREFVGTNS